MQSSEVRLITAANTSLGQYKTVFGTRVFKCTFLVNSDGFIHNLRITHSTGTATLDEQVQTVINKVAPFDRPVDPKAIKDGLEVVIDRKGILVDFVGRLPSG